MPALFIQQLLQPDITSHQLDQTLSLAIDTNIAGVCLPPFWIKKAHRDLQDSGLVLITAVGYPYGYQMTETKIQQIELALSQGADEFLVALNLSAFKSGMPWVKIELAKCAQLIHQEGRIMSVMLNPDYLQEAEIRQLILICKDAGADQIVFEAPRYTVSQILQWKQSLPQSLMAGACGLDLSWEDYHHLQQEGLNQIMGKNVLQIHQAQKTS